MRRFYLMEEFHVSMYVPDDLSEKHQVAIGNTLTHPRFQVALRKAVRRVVRRCRWLRQVRVKISK